MQQLLVEVAVAVSVAGAFAESFLGRTPMHAGAQFQWHPPVPQAWVEQSGMVGDNVDGAIPTRGEAR